MIEVRNISFFHGKRPVLRDVSFDVPPGECVGVLGNNGAGKSTLLTCLNRVRVPASGKVRIDGRDVLAMNREECARLISYVAQKNEAGQSTVFDTVLLGRSPHVGWRTGARDVAVCADMLERLGISHLGMRPLAQLSGGELQKVMLARALVQEPRLLLLDEPTSNLDPRNQHEMLRLVKDMARERQISVIMVIHDLSLALHFCDKFLFVKDGTVFRYGDASIIQEDTLRQVYGIETRIFHVEGRKIAIVA